MTPRKRLITALEGVKADRLPATTHHVMPYFLDTYMDGMTNPEFFAHFGLDPIIWEAPSLPRTDQGEYLSPVKGSDTLEMIQSDTWRIEAETLPDEKYPATRYRIVTPGGTLTTTIQESTQSSWCVEHLVKEKKDIDLIGEYMTRPVCNVDAVNRVSRDAGESALIRGTIPCFDLFGQPGCWQDAACLYGIEKLIMAAFEDPEWVHRFLSILQQRKLTWIDSLGGAEFDVLELGGGDGSSTVISPAFFETFVAPYDSELIARAQNKGQRIAYHTCGGMMPILELIAGMKPDAMETFTPPGMGGDTDLAEARRRIGNDICMIGGFDQFHFFTGCTAEETRAEVRRCFEAAGREGAFILCPSDHFFDAEPELIRAFADAAKECVY